MFGVTLLLRAFVLNIYASVHVYLGLSMQVSKWGNSLAIRLPAAVVEALELKEGDDIQIRVAGERSFEVERMPSRADIIARLRALRGSIPSDFKFDRLEANER